MQPPPHPLPRGRRYAVRTLLVLGAIAAVLSIVSVWANRQLLNADNWADTSTALLDDSAVRTAVSGYLVDEVYANVNVSAELASALPARLKPLAGPAAGGLRNAAETVTARALGRPRVQQAWRAANKLAAERFIAIAEGKSTFVTISGDTVYLDLRALLLDVVQRLGLSGRLVGRIPAGAGRIAIVTSRQASAVQDAAAALRGLAIVLPLAAFLLLAGAVATARGRRRETLRAVGWCLVVAGAVVLVAREVAGNRVVDSLARTDAVVPAAQATWSIGTSMLKDIAWAMVLGAIPIIAAAWLAGATRPAVALRRGMAPWLREEPTVAYAVAGVLVLLVIAWGPIPATRMVVPVLVMIGLVALGVAALRRQAAHEFPQASVAQAHVEWHDRFERARASVGGALHRRPAQAPHAIRAGNGAAPVATGDGGPHPGARPDADAERIPPPAERIALLERLAALHDRGLLSDEELAAEKAALPRP
ncbi:MAG: SHOCT domain-containing protein [Conexibacter sp.]